MTNSVFSAEAIKAKYPQIKEIGEYDFTGDPFLVEAVEYVNSIETASLDAIFDNFKDELNKYIKSKILNPQKSYKLLWRQYPAITGSFSPRQIRICARLKIEEADDK